MIHLEVEEFSCIKTAKIELKPITLVIGPQASGKSLISKLTYFFVDKILSSFGAFLGAAPNSKSLEKEFEKEFEHSFPAQAWGEKLFKIYFESGPLTILVERKHNAARVLSSVKVTISEFYKKRYAVHAAGIRRINVKRRSDDDFFYDQSAIGSWEFRLESLRFLIDHLKSDFVENQMFIPAGRSFYSNLNKAVPMLEHGSKLDTVTVRFGRAFTGLLDGTPRYLPREKSGARVKETLKRHRASIEAILGGKIKLGSAEKYIETLDGRVIPLGLMSSGQQELFSLLLTLQDYFLRNLLDSDPSLDLVYIEEPEAHLFPKSQSDLIRHIVDIHNGISKRCLMFITTHSPYVLSSLNNLILASQIAEKFDKSREVSEIVPKSFWLDGDKVAAYALSNGHCASIIDETGLIDGHYLDKVSSDITEEFSSLLDLMG